MLAEENCARSSKQCWTALASGKLSLSCPHAAQSSDVCGLYEFLGVGFANSAHHNLHDEGLVQTGVGVHLREVAAQKL